MDIWRFFSGHTDYEMSKTFYYEIRKTNGGERERERERESGREFSPEKSFKSPQFENNFNATTAAHFWNSEGWVLHQVSYNLINFNLRKGQNLLYCIR